MEIEFTGATPSGVEAAMRRVGLVARNEGYTHDVMSHWKIVTDSSCGYELVSPILSGEDGRQAVLKAMRALQDAGAVVNRSCGLHVHHGIGDLTGGALVRLAEQWQESQEALEQLVAPSRRGQYGYPCGRLSDGDVSTLRGIITGATTEDSAPAESARYRFGGIDRYRSLNFQAYSQYGTVEVRLHQGTLNATKALAWIAFGQAMIERAQAGPAQAPTSIRDLLDSLGSHGLESGTRAYLEDRAEAFAGGRVTA